MKWRSRQGSCLAALGGTVLRDKSCSVWMVLRNAMVQAHGELDEEDDRTVRFTDRADAFRLFQHGSPDGVDIAKYMTRFKVEKDRVAEDHERVEMYVSAHYPLVFKFSRGIIHVMFSCQSWNRTGSMGFLSFPLDTPQQQQ